MRLRHAIAAAIIATAGGTVASVDVAEAWPSNCTLFWSNNLQPGYAHGRCTSGTGWYRANVRCHPVGTTSSYVTRWGDWKNVQLSQGAISDADCGPRYPVAFDADLFGSNTNPN